MQATITCFFFVIVCILLFEPTESSEEKYNLYGTNGTDDCDVKDGLRLYSQHKFIRNLTTTEIEEARVFEEEASANIENVFTKLQSAADKGQGFPPETELEGDDYPLYPLIPAFCNGLGADKNVADSPPPIDGC